MDGLRAWDESLHCLYSQMDQRLRLDFFLFVYLLVHSVSYES